MGDTNHGSQVITYDYYENMTSLIVNSRHLGTKSRGIYSGGYMTKVTNSEITISPMLVEIGDGNIQVRVKTTASATINSGNLDSGNIASATPYIVLRRSHVESTVNYMEVHAIASVSVVGDNDIIVGKCIFDGATLTGFDYSERTFLNIQDLFLKVESTGATEMYVQLRAGRIQNNSGYIFVPEKKVGPFTAPSSPNSRIDLVYIDTDGTVKILQGTAAINPSAPTYGGKLVVAQVRLINGDTLIPANRITDVRSFIASPVIGIFGNWASRNTDTVYQGSTDGTVYALPNIDATGADIRGYTDSNNPPTTMRQCFRHRRPHSDSGYTVAGITMDVRKGDYWKVTGAVTVYWLPKGN